MKVSNYNYGDDDDDTLQRCNSLSKSKPEENPRSISTSFDWLINDNIAFPVFTF